MANLHKVFISYHHEDQYYKDVLTEQNRRTPVFMDRSVNTGDIDDSNLSAETIRTKIRDDYLKDSSVTVLLAGESTAGRKHVDWELYSSMIDGPVNKKSGIVVVQLPSVSPEFFTAGHGDVEKQRLYPEVKNWCSLSRAEYEERYPHLPERIIDQLATKNARVSVAKWSRLGANLENLALLIDLAHENRASCEYDLRRPMRMRNS